MAGRSKKERGVLDDRLNEASIIRAAREIIVTSGVEGLTMRRLSDALGVALGATYHYVPNRRALLQLVAQDIYAELALPSVRSGDWADHIYAAIVDFVRLLTCYPGMSAEVLRDPAGMSPPHLEAFVRERLTTAGFRGQNLSVVLAAIFFYVSGATALVPRPSDNSGTARAAMRHFEQGLRVLLRGVAASVG